MTEDRNCGCGNNFGPQPMYTQPVMPIQPIMPITYGNQYANSYNNQYGSQDFQGTGFQTIDQRLDNIEKRLAILEANLSGQSINSGFNSTNYQII